MTLQIPAELEDALRQLATVQGIDPAELCLKSITQLVQPKSDSLPKVESELLQTINGGFSEEWWARYRKLVEERRNESISEDQLSELIHLTDQSEAYGVRRLEALVELAKIRGVALENLMEDLGIRPNEVE